MQIACNNGICEVVHLACDVMDTSFNAIELARRKGIRKTAGLVEMMAVLSGLAAPASMTELVRDPRMRRWNRTTVYRLIKRLESTGLVCQVNIPHCGRLYWLNRSGGNFGAGFLVCRECRSVVELGLAPHLRAIVDRMSHRTGWSGLRCELEFFGVCSDCAETHADDRGVRHGLRPTKGGGRP